MKKFTCYLLIVCILLSISSVTIMAAGDLTYNENLQSVSEESAFYDEETIKYISLITPSVMTSSESNQNVEYGVTVNPIEAYDSVTVSYATTTGLNLDSYVNDTYTYTGDDVSIILNFDVLDSAVIDEVELDYWAATFEEIIVSVDVYVDNAVVETEVLSIYVYSTEDGTFIGGRDKLYAFNAYLNYLETNQLVTASEIKVAKRRLTDMPIMVEGDLDSNRAEILEKIDNLKSDNNLMKYYDASDNGIKISSKSCINGANTSGLITSNSVSRTVSEANNISDMSLTLSISVSSPYPGAVLNISGSLSWVSIDGVSHPAMFVKIDILDEDLFADPVITTVYTNSNGYFSVSIDNNITIFENGYDVYFKVYTSNDNFLITDEVGGSVFETEGYYFSTEPIDNLKYSTGPKVCVATNTLTSRAMNINQALQAGYYYYNAMNDGITHDITVQYPRKHEEGDDSNGSNSVDSLDKIRIDATDYCSWKTLNHELGHQVGDQLNINGPTSGEHGFGENLIQRYGKTGGVHTAWLEGWATYFCLAAQAYYCNAYPSVADIIGVCVNYVYSDIIVNDNGTYEVPPSSHYPLYLGCGEGDEAAIVEFFLELLNSDDFSVDYSDQMIWNLIAQSQSQTMSSFASYIFNNIRSGAYPEDVVPLGELMQRQGFSYTPLTMNNYSSIFSRNNSTIFHWQRANTEESLYTEDQNNYEYTNTSKLVFFNESFDKVYEIAVDSINANNNYTPTAQQWAEMVAAVGGDEFYWGLELTQTTAYKTTSSTGTNYPAVDTYQTGPYYSKLYRGVFEESIINISSLDIYYSCSFGENEEQWFSFTSTQNAFYGFPSLGNTPVQAEFFKTSLNVNSPIRLDKENLFVHSNKKGDKDYFDAEFFVNSGQTVYIKVYGVNRIGGSSSVKAHNVDSHFT